MLWYSITHKIVLMRVTLGYLEVIPAFIYVAENSLHRKHYDHVESKKKVAWRYQKILDD